MRENRLKSRTRCQHQVTDPTLTSLPVSMAQYSRVKVISPSNLRLLRMNTDISMSMRRTIKALIKAKYMKTLMVHSKRCSDTFFWLLRTQRIARPFILPPGPVTGTLPQWLLWKQTTSNSQTKSSIKKTATNSLLSTFFVKMGIGRSMTLMRMKRHCSKASRRPSLLSRQLMTTTMVWSQMEAKNWTSIRKRRNG